MHAGKNGPVCDLVVTGYAVRIVKHVYVLNSSDESVTYTSLPMESYLCYDF